MAHILTPNKENLMCNIEIEKRISQLTHKLEDAFKGNTISSLPVSKNENNKIEYYSSLNNGMIFYIFNVAGIPKEGIHAFIKTSSENDDILLLTVECNPLSYYYKGYGLIENNNIKRIANIELALSSVDLDSFNYKLENGFLTINFKIKQIENGTKPDSKISFHKVY